MFESLFPIFILGLLTIITVLVMTHLPYLLSNRTKSRRKIAPYECGIIPETDARQRIPVKFYLIAIIFIIFDIETVFIFPWALVFKDLGLFGLIEMAVFILILLIGYFYVIGKGVLKWE
jgi:NADH-quinone oxidoreductase subunit A